MLKERAAYYYGEKKKNCAEAMMLAGGEIYQLNITEDEVKLFTGFGGGMGCGSTCGALTGAIGVLSRMYSGRADLRAICGGFVKRFEQKLGAASIDCKVLEAKYKTPEKRCVDTVILGAEALEEYIKEIGR